MNKNKFLYEDIRVFIYSMVVFSILIAKPAHAYIDPGTGSVLIQVIVASVASTFFVGRRYIIIPIKKIFFYIKKNKKEVKEKNIQEGVVKESVVIDNSNTESKNF